MDFRSYKIMKEPGSPNVMLIGCMQDPVNWEFKITFEPDDIPGMMKVAMNISMMALGIKNMHKYITYLFNRKQFQDPAHDHLEEKVNKAYDQMIKRARRGARPA